MRRAAESLALGVLLALAVTVDAQAGDLKIFVLASASGTITDSPVSWLEGGFGKLAGSGDSDGSSGTGGDLAVQAGFRFDFNEHWSSFANVVARSGGETVEGSAAGIAELWIEGTREIAGGRLRARAGTMFLPTSRENVDRLWVSPYTISLSAINSWIGEEVRPTGLDVDYAIELAPRVRLAGAATAFAGNDTSGTLLAWRGWAIGNQSTVWGERLPLPPLPTFDTSFPAQSESTTPIGSDLDGRWGWSSRLRLDAPRGFVAQWTRYDNRGDRALYDDEYSWRTRFDLIGLGWQPIAPLTLAAEHVEGDSGMGFAPGDRVDIGFESTYVLASLQLGRLRYSARFDWFSTEERDFSAAESNDERGTALALAIMLDLSSAWSFALEVDDLDAERTSAAATLGTGTLDGRALLFRARYAGAFD